MLIRLIPLILLFAACQTPHSDAVADAGEEPLAARIGAEPITLAEVDARIQRENPDAWQALYEARRHALAAIVEQRLLDAEAARQGIAADSLTAREIAAGVAPVTDDDVADFYDRNIGRMDGQTLEEVGDQIRDYLSARAAYEARASYLDGLRESAGVELLLAPPRRHIEVGADEPAKGPADAPVVIVEYSDFECPYCQRGNATLTEVLATYGERVRLVFRDFPLAMHANAHSAAQAAQCAHEQGAFWPYHDLLFTDIRRLGPQDLRQAAAAVGLDTTAFAACLDSERFAAAVNADLASGQAHGISGTPAFFINGRFLSGAQPLAAFRQIIDEELERAGVETP